MERESLYVPLYPPYGGKPRAFGCQLSKGPKACSAITKTERGMLSHLWHTHKIKLQMDLFADEQTSEDVSVRVDKK